MNKLTRIAVIAEFEKDLKKYFPTFEKEKVFNKFLPTKRQFRADYYIPHIHAIIEINGGQFINGRHNRGGEGYETDLTKLNIANSNGCPVMQYTYEMLKRKDYIPQFEVLKEKIMHF